MIQDDSTAIYWKITHLTSKAAHFSEIQGFHLSIPVPCVQLHSSAHEYNGAFKFNSIFVTSQQAVALAKGDFAQIYKLKSTHNTENPQHKKAAHPNQAVIKPTTLEPWPTDLSDTIP